jgi:uncharacterized circularly permuted ATP-grasp superfamily protein/uncharacterized alpha-E superfamily protein
VSRGLPFEAELAIVSEVVTQQTESLPNELVRSSSGELGARYPFTDGVYDELLAAPGERRSHWEPFLRALERLGPAEVQARGETARRFLRENGVTYNVYGDAKGFERTWELDALPLLIPPDEWARIESGLLQRTHLLSRILADLYGPQRLLHEHRIPPALVFANPSFLRPCRGLRPAGDLPLLLHAVDLMRSPDGQWWAMADRTQAPSGTGYALVNRIALSRAFPDEFRDCRVQRLASFFQIERDTLRTLAPLHRDNPNVVLLTPGAYNETYFEHAYLARYLGLPLVEGGDLTVRDRRVFIKTIEGLQPVDVILRRVDDTFCDPLELRADSFLGVPGLVEAVRAGNVAVANPLGSGVVETPALLAFLPGLSRHLLGEELKLPSVATWWCGQPLERQHVADNLRQFIVKRAFPTASGEPFFGRRLDSEGREALLADIQVAPHAFVGQEQVALSTVPAWRDGRLVPRPLVLRVFVIATRDGYRVMPGGLTRVSPVEGGPVVSTQSGGSSKDTWVLTDGAVSTVTLLKPPAPIVRLERRASEVPSRIADNLFWLGRYAERLEDTIRLLRVAVSRLAGESVGEPPPELAALVQLLVELELFPRAASERASTVKVEKHLLLLVYQASRAGSVRDVLNRLRHSAFVVRDRFTADTWRIFNRLQLDARVRPRHIPVTESLALLNTLVLDLAAFNGMAMENMTRGHGWLFLDLGRRIERSSQLLAVLQAALRVDPAGQLLLEPVLEIADSVMTYRRSYYERPQPSGVLDLLLLDETNPRSIAFQLAALAAHAVQLPATELRAGPVPESALIDDAVSRLRSADLIALTSAAVSPEALRDLLQGVQDLLGRLSDALTRRYFAHADARAS